MAAVSAAQTATATNATTLTPPSSSHGNGYAWDNSLQQLEDPAYIQQKQSKSHVSQNGIALTYGLSNPVDEEALQQPTGFGDALEQDSAGPGRSRATSAVLPDDNADIADNPRSTTTASATKRGGASGPAPDDTNSKWIHRDKLLRIESEELQAAGIILPKSRARSRPRRDISVDRSSSHYRKHGQDADVAARNDPAGALESRSAEVSSPPDWDLRLPEEIAQETYFASPYGTKTSSRIPVAKISPVPIPLQQMERDAPLPRRRNDSTATEESIAYPKRRSRSAGMRSTDRDSGSMAHSPPRASRSTSDMSPRKASRKASGPLKTMPGSGGAKGRNGANKDSTRPSTRSGERELSREASVGAASRQPEGEPPWMVSAYRPDPRLPPDQQLLPTVARRLQQEKWEREGKFGSVYDKEFRPLTDDGFLDPPEPSEKPGSAGGSGGGGGGGGDEWPLKPEVKSPTAPPGRAGSYSTIPKIHDQPNMSPLPSPRPAPTSQAADAGTAPAPAPTRDEDDSAKQGCGCCVVM